ncbi:methyltransferase [Roseovarius sp. D22-M7]|uniref:methyltransferase n=1 Tax=Roseovarius sp. D22-M7 TaxID=3127116 RepID=UPI00300FA158
MASHDPPRRRGVVPFTWLNRLVARADVQRIAARLPVGRTLARRDGAEIFDLVQGFVQSGVLSALIELRILHRLMDGPRAAADMAPASGIAPDRMEILLQAGAAMGLLRRRRDGRFRIARKGAAILGVPGLEAMIGHHHVFYDDMADPVALLRGEGETGLAKFWPYVHGAGGTVSEEDAARYSDLMAQSQALVAQDTLGMMSLRGARRLLDVGGGSGVFAAEVAARYPALQVSVLDLPEVIPGAERRLAGLGLGARITCVPGSFRDEPLPDGADVISLIRVLYDHDDATVADLLAKVLAALPPGGRLIVSEPMSGGVRPDPACDVYFAFYTMAMGTGRTRSAATIGAMCRAAGFERIRIPRPPRPYVTSALSCVKPG